jgi:hypothetical protein
MSAGQLVSMTDGGRQRLHVRFTANGCLYQATVDGDKCVQLHRVVQTPNINPGKAPYEDFRSVSVADKRFPRVTGVLWALLRKIREQA